MLAGLLGLCTFVGGSATVLGWLLGIYRLTDWEGGGISMKANAGLAAALCGLGVWAAAWSGMQARWLVRISAGLCTTIGGLTLLQHATGLNLGIDTLLSQEAPGARATAAPNRMGIPGATCFLCLGLAGMLTTGSARERWYVSPLCTAACAVASLSLFGFILGAESMYTIPGLTGIALQTTGIVIALACGTMALVPEQLPVRKLLDRGTAGMLIRRALPLALLLPVSLAWIYGKGNELHVVDETTGRSLLILTLTSLQLLLLFWAAGVIRRGESKAVAAERVHAGHSAALARDEAAARQRFEAVIDAMAQPFAIFDGRGCIVRTNPAFRALHRNDPALLETTPTSSDESTLSICRELFDRYDIKGRLVGPNESPVARGLRGERVVAEELFVVRRELGWSYTGVFNAVPLRDTEDHVTGVVLTATDISERKLEEARLKDNEALFSALIDEAPLGVYVVDSDFRVRQVNPIASPAFRNVEPVIGRNFAEVMRTLWGPQIGDSYSDIFRHTLATGEPYTSSRVFHRRYDLGIDEAYDWETRRITLPDGKRGVVCYFRDVSEHLRAEAQLQAAEERTQLATSTAGVGIWEWNIATGMFRWNAEMFRIYGEPCREDGMVSYDEFRSKVHPEDVASIEGEVWKVVRRVGREQFDYRIRRADGQIRHIHMVFVTRADSEGKPEWVVGTNFDVTELRHAEQLLERRIVERTAELERSQAALRRSERLAAIGTLAAGLGHDLANLMLPMRMRLDALDARDLPGSAKEELTGIRDGLKYLQQLSSSLRLLAADPDAPPPPGGTDLAKWWPESAGMARAATPRGIRLESEIAPGLPPVNVAPAALAQAVFNLVQNAGEAISGVPDLQGRGHIRISIGPSPRGENWAQIAVSDTGPGMSPETMARCFEPYFSTKGRAVSTGLGLALVRGVAESAGGVVECASELGSGTTFTIHLPPAPMPQTEERITAVLDVKQPRLAAIVNVLLKSMHVVSGKADEISPKDAAIWVTDHDPGDALAEFIASAPSADPHPSPRAVIIFQDVESNGDFRMLDGHHDAVIYAGRTPHASDIRNAVTQAISRTKRSSTAVLP